MDIVEDWEKYRALEAILEELPALLNPDEDGYVPAADVYVEQVRQALTIAAEAIAARNE